MEITFSKNEAMNIIQINAERETTYIMLQQNNKQLLAILSNAGINQANIKLSFGMQEREFDKRMKDKISENIANKENDIDNLNILRTEYLGNGLDKAIKSANLSLDGVVGGVSLLI